MKKKISLLLLAFVLVFSSSIVAFAEETLGEPAEANIPTATGAEALAAIADTKGSVVIDLRSAADYAVGHIKGTISLPVCLSESEGYAVTQTLKDNFVNYVKSNPDMASKKIYLVCYVGTFCVNHAAGWLQEDCGIPSANLYRVTGGVWNDADLAASLTCVTAEQALSVIGNDKYIILDVRAAEVYADGNLKGSVSLPLFTREGDKNVPVAEPYTDELSQAFTKYAQDNKEMLSAKEGIYILCNSGSKGAVNATNLLGKEGITSNVYTIEGGATNQSIQIAFNNTVTGTEAVAAVGSETVVIIDVRTKENYDKGHLKGSISMPLFDANGVTNGEDALAKAFTESVKANAEKLAGKDIYILCNSGARGAQAATKLLKAAGYANSNIFTITGGAKGVEADMSVPQNLTYVSADQTLSVIGNDDFVIIDVRAAEKYEEGHLKGSVSLPLFTVGADGKNVPVAEPYTDELSQAFLKYVEANKETLSKKTIYILCNSGSRGAVNATALLAKSGITANVFTIEGGALNQSLVDVFVKEAPQTGDMAPTMGYILVMLAAAAVIVASKKKLAK